MVALSQKIAIDVILVTDGILAVVLVPYSSA